MLILTRFKFISFSAKEAITTKRESAFLFYIFKTENINAIQAWLQLLNHNS